MRPALGGIEAFSERQSDLEIMKGVSAFCFSENKLPMLTFLTEKNDSIKNDEDLKSEISSIKLKVSDNDLEDIDIPIYRAIALVEPNFFAITVPLSKLEQEKILSASMLTVEIDAPRYLFSGFINEEIMLKDNDKEIIRLAWRNCIQ